MDSRPHLGKDPHHRITKTSPPFGIWDDLYLVSFSLLFLYLCGSCVDVSLVDVRLDLFLSVPLVIYPLVIYPLVLRVLRGPPSNS